jgi:3-oxoacyl-[acyl-carrier protein] reductase
MGAHFFVTKGWNMGNVKFDFSNKNFVVTGGGQGIGFEITKMFLESGANVTVWDYSEQALKQLESELNAYSSRLNTTKVDVGDRKSCESAVQKLNYAVHGLINNAGITRDKSFTKMEESQWDDVIRTNLTGLFHVTQSLLPKFDENSSNKRIVNMASVVALYGNFGQTNYVATKSGVIGMTKTWAKELGRKGFTVNAVAPGFIMTAMTKAMPETVLDSMKAKVPSGRLGETLDIANACLFLCSEEASYINGHTLSVDGSISM